jgi:dipeptidase E
MGWVDFALIPHYDAPEHHDDASLINAEIWASKIAVPTYAIDDHTAIQVRDGKVEVVSEGKWKRYA